MYLLDLFLMNFFLKLQVQYEVRTHTMCITFEKVTGSTADTYLQYVQHNLPEGVAVKVTKVICTLDFVFEG